MTSTTTENIRLTITVTPEVHQIFQRFAKASGMSLGKCMGEWLGDTSEGALLMVSKMEEARAAPALVLREMNAMMLGMADETSALLDQLRRKGISKGGPDAAAGAPASVGKSPPPGNTGGKGTGKPPKLTRGHRGSKS
jgi:hypothetical protein